MDEQKWSFCPNCGSKNRPERKSCFNCETPLSQNRKLTLWQKITTIATVCATLAAIAAIGIGYYQYENQLNSAKLIAHANIKPLLQLSSEYLGDKETVYLFNYGIGSAVITNITFYRKDGASSKRGVWDLFIQFPYPADFQYHVFSQSEPAYISPEGEIILTQIDWNSLKKTRL
jgi:hypothetical protein